MSDITELERRIAAALDRIGAGVENWAPGGDQAALADLADAEAEITELEAALVAERTANEQLENRVRAIHERQESHVARLEREVAQLRQELLALGEQSESLRRLNTRLRENNDALRAANAAGLADPGLIDAGMAGALDALRATRDSDRAELDAILASLAPMVLAPEGEENA